MCGVNQSELEKGTLVLARALFHDAVDTARFRVPELLMRSLIWSEIWIPFIEMNPMDGQEEEWMKGYIERNREYLATGWVLGDVNEDNKPLNMKTYPINNPKEERAILKDLTTDLFAGRIVEWKGKIRGKLPLFVRPKKRDPVTDEVIRWRVIRDGTCGSAENPSINDLTPDSAAKMRLVTHDMIQRVLVIFQMIWGKALMAKTDLEAAFRQFYLKPGETEKIIYDVAGRILGDLMNVWGTRTGSRICQDFTAMVTRAYMLWKNGVHLREDINAVQRADAAYFRQKYDAQYERNEETRDPEDVADWTKEEVQDWIRTAGLNEVSDILHSIEDGRELILSHEVNLAERLDEQSMARLKHANFFEKLESLKINTRCCITIFVVAYVDDIICILAPNQIWAERTFKNLTEFLAFGGLLEKEEKRSKVSAQMEVIGVQYDAERMVMDITPTRKAKIRRKLCKGLERVSVERDDYESLIGQLSYVGQMAWPGLAFLRRMRARVLAVIREKGRGDDIVFLEDWELKDWKWWIMFLDSVTEVDILERWNSEPIEDTIYVDGATNGSREKGWNPAVGVWWKGHYISKPIPARFRADFSLRPGAPRKDFAIPHFEMLSIVVAFHNLREYMMRGTKMMLMTDNKHCEAAIINKGSDDDFLMDAVRWLMMFAVDMNMRIYVQYVNTHDNKEADWLSRFRLSDFRKYVQEECQQKGWDLQQIENVDFPDIHCW